ncbi:MAG: hypothetical protein ACLT38_06910 [Akkermansia sp.]
MSLNYNFIWLLCYLLVLVGLAGYGFHRLSIVYLYWKNRNNKPQPKARFQELPVVTVQLPMFNEKFVVDRLLESVAALDYPQDRLEIQILDDSTDDTTEQCCRKVEELKSAALTPSASTARTAPASRQARWKRPPKQRRGNSC